MTHIWLNVYLYILNYKHVKCKPIKSCYICALYIYKYMSCIFLGGIMFNAGWKFVRGLVFSCTSHWLFPLVLGPWHARLTQTPCCYVDTHTHKPTWGSPHDPCVRLKRPGVCRVSSPKPTLAWIFEQKQQKRIENKTLLETTMESDNHPLTPWNYIMLSRISREVV